MKNLIGLFVSIILCQSLYAAEIVQVEYFFDSDPGYENGVNVPITPGGDVTAEVDVDVSELETGHHMFYIRAKDANDNWSLDHARPIFKVDRIRSEPFPDIVKMEYFIDSDPGYGNGTDIPFETGADVVADAFIDLSDVELGHHMLYIRAKNGRGEWSLSHFRPFFKTKMTEADGYEIVKLEYFIDEDPGYGNGVDVPITPGRIVSADITVDLKGAYLGTHTLFIRAQDEFGDWSLLRREEIEVTHDVAMASAAPATVVSGGTATLNLIGPMLPHYTDAKLVGPGGFELEAVDIFRMSDTEISVSFTLEGVAPGLYDVVVYNDSGQQSALSDAVRVAANGMKGHLRVSATPPEFVRPGRRYTCWIKYENDGNSDLSAPLFVVSNSADAPMRISEHEPFQDGHLQILGANLNGPAGWLPPGSVNRIPVYFMVPNNAGGDIEFTVEKMVADEQPVDWSAVESEIKPDDMNEDAWDVIWARFRDQMGYTWAEYLGALNRDATYISLHRESKETVLAGMEMDVKDATDTHVYDVRTMLGFEMRKASAALSPRSVLAASQDVYLPAPGLSLAFGRFAPQSIEGRFTDGPFGRGWAHTYQYRAEERNNGNVYIGGPGGTARAFQKLPDGSYQGSPGDYAVLTVESDAYVLREKSGIKWRFDLAGNLLAIRDLNGNQLAFFHTADGLNEIVHSNGDSISILYDGNGRIIEVADSAGQSVLYRYDAAGDYLTEVEEPGGVVTQYTYRPVDGSPSSHALTQISLTDAPSYHYAYDDQGRLKEEWADGDTERMRYAYGDAGKVTVTDKAGKTSTIWFGPMGEVLKVTDPLGNTVKNTFNGGAQSPQIIGPDGNSATIAYDMNGNPAGVRNPLGDVIKMDYDPELNRLTRLTDARFNSTEFGHDDRGNMESITYPDLTTEYFETDNAGNVTAYTNRRDQTIDFQFNHRGQVAQKTYPNGRIFTYEYNANGLMTSAIDSLTGAISMQYDDRDYLSRIEYPDGYWFEFEYNNAGQRTRRVGHDGYELNYAYDEGGRLAEMTDGAGDSIIQYEYDAAGRLAQEIKGNGTRTVYAYDDAGQLLSLINYSPDGEVQSRFEYTHDEDGNRTSMTTLDGKTLYDYDDIGQLVGVTYPDGRWVTYEYDAAGNRVRVTDDGETTYYSTNAMNQYTYVGNTAYAYDDDGNMVSKVDADGQTNYVYDAENRLIRVETPNKGSWQHTYDALGNRIAVDHDGVVTTYVYDPFAFVDMVTEYNGTGTLKARYSHGIGLISRADSDGNSAYYSFDGTGHTRQITNPDGIVVSSYDYSPFGVPIKTIEMVENPFQYVGRFGVMKCGNGLQYMRARFYMPFISKFVSFDPIRFYNGEINLNKYVHNNPLQFIDPEGEIAMIIIGAGTAAIIAGTFAYYAYLEMENTKRAKEKIEKCKQGFRKQGLPNMDAIDLCSKEMEEYGQVQEQTIERLTYVTEVEKSLPSSSTPSDIFETISVDILERMVPWVQEKSDEAASVIARVIRSFDPNEKASTPGIGTQNSITVGTKLAYTIYFENLTSATAPAQEVYITDTLDPDLDWTTFQLGEIAFGDAVFSTMKGQADHNERVSYKNMAVDLIVESDTETGEIKWTLRTIDPDTGELPEDVFAGFLPPEDGNGAGQGYVTFTIHAREDLEAETRITNKSSIVFDTNAPIVTNEVFNTITHDAPAASAEPYTEDGATDVPVSTVLSWAASDYAAGYDLYLWRSDDAQPADPMAGDLATPFYEPIDLAYGTTYKWKVVSKNIMGESAGPVWTFTTAAESTTNPLRNALMILQVLTGIDRDVSHISDVDGDGHKGLGEAVYWLRFAAGN